MEQANKNENQELVALNILAKAAENYLASLDELARGPTTLHLQQAIAILAKAVTSTRTETQSEEPVTPSKK